MRDPGQPGRFGDNAGTLQIDFVKRGGWIGTTLAESFEPPILDVHEKIEDRARLTELLGPQPLWDGYSNVARYPRATEGTRRPDQVRIRPLWGRFMSWLAATRKSEVVVEFGTAFGVSGMYWLAGLQMGHLFTFEPNRRWAEVARENLSAISDRYTLTVDCFEAAAGSHLRPGSVDIAFVDAIHTSSFVLEQYRVLELYMRERGLVLFDDINFSADMEACWHIISRRPGITASARLNARVGIIEL